MNRAIFPDGSEGVVFGLSAQALDRLRKAIGDIRQVVQESVPEEAAPEPTELPPDLDLVRLALRIGGVAHTPFVKSEDLTQPDSLALRTVDSERSLVHEAIERGLPADTVLECERMYRSLLRQQNGKPAEPCSLDALTQQAFATMHRVYSGRYFEQIQRMLAQEAAVVRSAEAETKPRESTEMALAH